MIDTGPARVTGAIRAAKARVVWQDDTLYVINKAGKVDTYLGVAEPQRRNGGYTFEHEGRKGSFYRSGCNCSYPQGKTPVEEIVK